MISLARATLLPSGPVHLTSAFRSTRSLTFLHARITVAWFLPPITLPISGYDIFVNFLVRYMLKERATLIVRILREE